MKCIIPMALAISVAGCSVMTGEVEIDGKLKPAEVQAVSRDLASAVLVGRLVNGAPIFRDDQGKGSLICDLLADPANSDTTLGILAANGVCDVFTLATGEFPPVPVVKP